MWQLTRSLLGQRKFEAAAQAAKQAIGEAAKSPGNGLPARTRRAIAARDYASAVTLWKQAGAIIRADAAKQLDLYCGSELPNVFGRVSGGALLLAPPSRAEIEALRIALSNSL